MLSPVVHHITTIGCFNYREIVKEGSWVLGIIGDVVCSVPFTVVWIILPFHSQFQYTEELLRQQQFLEVYLEGTRSRSGKPSPARAGMLSIVVDTLCASTIPDVLIVPVGISYDRIIEGNYNSEQLVGVLLWVNVRSNYGVTQGVFIKCRFIYNLTLSFWMKPLIYFLI